MKMKVKEAEKSLYQRMKAEKLKLKSRRKMENNEII